MQHLRAVDGFPVEVVGIDVAPGEVGDTESTSEDNKDADVPMFHC